MEESIRNKYYVLRDYWTDLQGDPEDMEKQELKAFLREVGYLKLKLEVGFEEELE